MDLIQLLEDNYQVIIDEASNSLARAHLKHYEQAGAEQTQDRLKSLFELTVRSVKKKNLAPMISFSEQLAWERFNAGFDLYEVQTAFNVLEETIWKRILKELPSAAFAEAFGLVSTVLGAGKDALARTYVSLASESKTPTLDLTELFEGAEG
ncbi:hypothetical protein GWO43_11415 [candidate division KSB1 bacterium]|nr:hypothetical protein [candidate division KSB1 bacterium]NIR70611.1 hypothetical protein [candidate division KSB1 bacterium]NIS24556.1 hypothetical protein [candidate division KSB1 bacterium]NIT71474.1 hypothetical protein [candidate division KSB1 bacterium]NIU25165.1 hypothetical protein [candidate division KSB1 bacterium]